VVNCERGLDGEAFGCSRSGWVSIWYWRQRKMLLLRCVALHWLYIQATYGKSVMSARSAAEHEEYQHMKHPLHLFHFKIPMPYEPATTGIAAESGSSNNTLRIVLLDHLGVQTRYRSPPPTHYQATLSNSCSPASKITGTAAPAMLK